MKKILILFVLLSVTGVSKAQDTITIYYNKDWKEINNKEQAAFYRRAFLDENKLWVAFDYYISGKIQMLGSYSNKKMTTKHGNFVYYFENGNKSEEGKYIDGNLEGEWTVYYDNGKKKRQGVYKENKGNGYWTYWFENGEKKSEGVYASDIKNGNWIYYHENGKKKSEGNMTNDKVNGKWTFWFDNGTIQGMGKFVDNEKDSVWVHYDKYGNLSEENVFVDKQIISAIGYHDNTKIAFKGSYKNGKKNGLWQIWNKAGLLIFSGEFIKGNKQGEWIRNFPDGESMKIFYKDDIVQNRELGSAILE